MPCFIDTDFSQYRTMDLINPEGGQIAAISAELRLPYLGQFLEDLYYVEDFRQGNVRRYVENLCTSGSFTATCPATGEEVSVTNSFVFDDLTTIFFFFGAMHSFALVAADLSLGFPITNYIDLDSKLILALKPTYWTIRDRHFAILDALNIREFTPLPQERELGIVLGDSNFAHHAWNELSTLSELAEMGLDRGVSLYVCHEALGPVNEILGTSFDIARKLTKGEVHPLNDGQSLKFAVGGRVITLELRDRIIAFARRNLSSEVIDLLSLLDRFSGNILWVSVRTRNRTLTNQLNVLTTIIQTYLAGRPDRIAIIDGHALPFDHLEDPEFLRARNDDVVLHDRQTIDEIIATVKNDLPTANVVATCGIFIHETITLAQKASLYFCHHGTVQHKIGWFSDAPGIVHCNRKVLETRPSHWVAEKSEIATLPTYVPDELIGNDDAFNYADDIQRSLSVETYTVTSLDDLRIFFTTFVTETEQARN